MAYPSFSDLAHRLIEAAAYRDDRPSVISVRESFDALIDRVAPVVPPGPDATHAAREIHRACQSIITSINLKQEE